MLFSLFVILLLCLPKKDVRKSLQVVKKHRNGVYDFVFYHCKNGLQAE